jgi:hypothetical protein
MNYASLNLLPLPKSVQSNAWGAHALVALYLAGAVPAGGEIPLRELEERMTLLAGGTPVSRVSATRGAWVLDKGGHMAPTRKGWYALSESGVEYARRIMRGGGGAPEPAPVVVAVAPPPAPEPAPVAPPPAPVVVAPPVQAGGVVWLPPVVATGDPSYLDGYLLGLAVEQTPCFGTYSARAEACAGCPIAGACAEMLVTRLSQLSLSLRISPPVAAPAPAPVVEAPPAPPAAPPVEAPVAAPPVEAPPVTPLKGVEISAAIPVICSKCRVRIQRGEKCMYIAGQGVYHPGCV